MSYKEHQDMLDKYNYFVYFCIEHGRELKSHRKFMEMQEELRTEIEKMLHELYESESKEGAYG